MSIEDVHVLGKLPSLVYLEFKVGQIPTGWATFGKLVFPVLEHFRFWPWLGDVTAFLVFEEGAMPKLRTLELHVQALSGVAVHQSAWST
jgi:hypothetical protein